MCYNLLEFPEANPQNREIILRDILDEYSPDIFMVCELQSGLGADLIVNNSLNYSEDRYRRATFVPNQSGGANLQQLLFFRKDKFILENEEVISTNVRDINHYTLKLSTADVANNPVRIEIFITHLKSSTGGSNEQQRLNMVQHFTNRLETLDPNAFVIFAGDLNLYSSTEPAYIELLDPTNAIVMIDPINTPGAWTNNVNFQGVHTQSTRISSSPFGAGSGGGLDDRFDFVLISENMNTNPLLHYIPNTYKAFGNNGNCFNLSINDSNCNGLFGETLRDNLYYMSDHLPVVMDLETNEEIVILNTNTVQNKPLFKLKNTLVTETLSIENNRPFPITVAIFNTLGQRLKEFHITTGENTQIDVSWMPAGLYFLNEISPKGGTVKFVKE
ncbi:MAG: T9SS type A sorting domain-containing protein [Flavobacteriaceae bacterium]|nr:T9SS type A sorting domain-containing protein [Flavobacteriaceae bacterium]